MAIPLTVPYPHPGAKIGDLLILETASGTEIYVKKEVEDPGLPIDQQYECSLCRTPLHSVPSPDGRRVVVEVASGSRHGCWQSLPRDAKVILTEDR